MKKQLATLALLAVAGSALLAPISATAARAADKDVDVYILAGQSNAVGNSVIDQEGRGYRAAIKADDARNDTGYEEIFYYGAIEVHATTEYSGSELTNVHFGLGNGTGRMGPELGMAKALSEHYTKDSPAAIIKSAVGGTYLGDYDGTGNANTTKTFGGWASPSLIEEWEESGISVYQYSGKLYERLIETVTYGLQALRTAGFTPHIKAYLWMQGESDTEKAVWANAYEHNLELLITDMREDIAELTGDEAAKTRPFVIGKIAEDFANHGQPFIDTVRAAEDAVAAKLPFTYTVETDGTDGLPKLSLAKRENGDNNGSDPWHFNAADMYDLGQRFGRVAYSHLAKYSYSVQVGEGGTADKLSLLTDGEPVSFTYTANRGKLLDKVLLNGTDVTSTAVSGNTVTVTPDTNTPATNSVELVFKNAAKYKLKLNLGAGGTIKRNISGSTVYEGETLTFTLSPNEGYSVDKVLANGTELTKDGEGKYSVTVGTSDLTLDITFKQGAETSAPTSPAEGGNGQGGENNLGVILGCTAAGVVVVAGAVTGVCLFLKKKKNR